jgi:hypothetical protein
MSEEAVKNDESIRRHDPGPSDRSLPVSRRYIGEVWQPA